MPLLLAAVLNVIFALVFGWSANDPHDTYDSSIPGSYEAYQQRQRARFWKGFLLGPALFGGIVLGNWLGLAGVALAAGIGALAGAVLTSR